MVCSELCDAAEIPNMGTVVLFGLAVDVGAEGSSGRFVRRADLQRSKYYHTTFVTAGNGGKAPKHSHVAL